MLDGALHLNFGDWQYWPAPIRLSRALGSIAADRATAIVDQLVDEFFAEQFGGRPSALIGGERRFAELAIQRSRR